MKNSIFFVAKEYELSRAIAVRVAEFFGMRLFDSIEMFEFDNAPRKIDEITRDFGIEYVQKEMRSTIKMSLDFDDTVVVADFDYIDNCSGFYKQISKQNLVAFLDDKNEILSEEQKLLKLVFLSDACDVAIDVTNQNVDEVFNQVIIEIKKYFNVEE